MLFFFTRPQNRRRKAYNVVIPWRIYELRRMIMYNNEYPWHAAGFGGKHGQMSNGSVLPE
ncbi:hypothetical protein SAMN04487895_11953 [Paenibacillus sophorae]|uniref:Uncharacterized protein n=1 Tax=Paenibacillus sophorae TaxID=1333845 RepID=A0A1H8UV21_9BACL|nr:hypothetical protein SAMN04487895_11953 [Paenibacillus sophorae]